MTKYPIERDHAIIISFLVLGDLKGQPKPPKRPDLCPRWSVVPPIPAGGDITGPSIHPPRGWVWVITTALITPSLMWAPKQPTAGMSHSGWRLVSLSVVYFLILLLLLCVFEIILPLCEDHHSLTTSRNKERLGSANLQENYETSHTQIWALTAEVAAVWHCQHWWLAHWVSIVLTLRGALSHWL